MTENYLNETKINLFIKLPIKLAPPLPCSSETYFKIIGSSSYIK